MHAKLRKTIGQIQRDLLRGRDHKTGATIALPFELLLEASRRGDLNQVLT